MIALDTNILVRLVTRDHEGQALRVKALFDLHEEKEGVFFVSDIVLCEMCWTLDRGYRHSRDEIGVVLAALLENRSLSLESPQAVEEALGVFRTVEAGFPDCLIAVKARLWGCSKTVSFDRKMGDFPGVEIL